MKSFKPTCVGKASCKSGFYGDSNKSLTQPHLRKYPQHRGQEFMVFARQGRELDIFQQTNNFLWITGNKRPSPVYSGELKMKIENEGSD